jgi:tetratricopeptide (TPR) repeat protein
MTSCRPHRFPLFWALMTLVLFGAPAAAQEQRCEQHEPREERPSSRAKRSMERAREEVALDKRGEYLGEALALLEEGLESDPDNPIYYLITGQAYVALEDYAAADSMWDRAVCMWEPYSNEVEAFRVVAWTNAFNRAQEAISQGDTAASMVGFRKAYTILDTRPYPIFQVAAYSVRQAQLADTDSALQANLELAIWGFQEALASARRSESLTDDERREFIWTSIANLAQIQAYQGQLLQAAELYQLFLGDFPGDSEGRSRLASLLAARVSEIGELLQRVEDEAERETLQAEADSLRRRAMSEYNALLAADESGRSADQHHDLAIGLYRLDLYEDAARLFGKALELEPYRPQSLKLLGNCLYLAERYDTLVTVGEQLVERYGYNTDNLALLAHGYRGAGDSERALEVLERREALSFQLVELNLEGGVATGAVENHSLEPGTPIEVEFIFYDSAGNVVGTSLLSEAAPAQGGWMRFQVAPEAPVAGVSGFAYRVVQPA